MPRINITTNDGLLVSSIEAPPSYALEGDWRFHAVARNMPGWLAHFVRNAEIIERRDAGAENRTGRGARRLARN